MHVEGFEGEQGQVELRREAAQPASDQGGIEQSQARLLLWPVCTAEPIR